jgi:hypothetical protein
MSSIENFEAKVTLTQAKQSTGVKIHNIF